MKDGDEDCAVCAFDVFFVSPARAEEWVFAIGGDDLLDEYREEAVAVVVEYRSDPFTSLGSFDFSWLVSLQADSKHDHFLGAGVNAITDLGRGPTFVEFGASVGPYFQSGSSLKMPDDWLIRTSIGFGVHLSERTRLSISIDHLLNSKLKNRNPGSEAILLRITNKF